MNTRSKRGFTLIELSIVLVIIGLIVGGVLTGQTLIAAAGVRAQISQIEKYNTAAATFQGKYGYLPGDIPDPSASKFGLVSRGQYAGQGDGNGVIEGNSGDCAGCNNGQTQWDGETTTFWNDLGTVHLIDGTFIGTPNTGNVPGGNYFTTGAQFNTLWPQAKIGNGNYVYVYSTNGQNYFSISQVTGSEDSLYSSLSMTVAQAYAIDRKMDDGLPASGNVTAQFVQASYVLYANPTYLNYLPYQTAPSASTCIDNGNVGGASYTYSLSQNNGAGANCALSFKMQAGD